MLKNLSSPLQTVILGDLKAAPGSGVRIQFSGAASIPSIQTKWGLAGKSKPTGKEL